MMREGRKRNLKIGAKKQTADVPQEEEKQEEAQKPEVPYAVAARTENTMRRIALLALTPPADLTVSEWAEQNRYLSQETAAEPGLWRTSRTPYLREIMDAFTNPRVRHIVFVAASQVGKALALDTPIPVPGGWSCMGDLQVGDEVFDERGEIVRVTFSTEVMYDHPCYTVRFSDGAEIVADADHQWQVYKFRNHKEDEYTVRTTREIAETYKRGNRNIYSVPVAGALKCDNHEELILPPYTLGVWLGDGHSYSSQVTVWKRDIEIADNMRKYGTRVDVHPKEDKSCIILHIDQKDGTPDDEATGHAKLTRLGVLKNKHIPKQYLRAGYEDRLHLLQGIMDTDGSIDAESGRCEITFCNDTLAYDVSELLLTLGVKNTITKRTCVCTNASNGRKEVDAWRISFLPYDYPVFTLARKAASLKGVDEGGRNGGKRRTTETYRRRIVSVEPHESVPVKCIQVSGESHLYLAGREMIPTHNSEAENNIIGYIIDQDPGSILFIHPTLDDAKDFSKLRIEPMIRDCPVLKEKVAAKKSRDSANTIRQKSYPGGVITLTGSTEAHALASKPIRYIIGDEMDRWAESAGREGDPWELAMARQTTFYNAKAVEVSTPTIKGHSRIAAAYSTGTQERWCSQCPQCGQYREIKWANIRFEYDEHETDGGKVYTVRDIHYVCPACGGICEEADMKKADARWEMGNPNAMANGTRSFWLNAFCSPWASWESIILKFLQAKGDSKKLQVTYNTAFGELWEDRGDLQDEGDLMLRREDYGKDEAGNPVELPEGVLALTCGVDTQDDRLEYEIVGHGMFGETWGIKKGVIFGRPDDEKVWRDLDSVLDHTYTFKDGLGLKVLSTFIDEGGHFTAEVRQQCKARQSRHVFPIKGIAGSGRPFTSNPKQMKITINKRVIGTCWTYQIGVDSGKSIIMDNLRVQSAGAKYCHFPKRADYDAKYFASLLSERLVYHEKARQPWQWEKIPGHERNEALDCRNYALAAFAVLPTDLEKTEREIKSARAKVNGTAETDILPDGNTVTNTVTRADRAESAQSDTGDAEDTISAILPEQPRRRVNAEVTGTRTRTRKQNYFDSW